MIATHTIFATVERGKPYFIVKYKDPDSGKWKNKRAPVDRLNEVEVERWFINEYKPKPNACAPAQTKTIESLATWWFEYRSEDPELHNRKGYINNWVLGKGESEDLPKKPHALASINLETELEPKVCRDFIRSIDRAPSTVRNIVQTVRTLIDDARKEQKLDFRTLNLFRDKIVLDAINGGKPVTKVAGDENTIYLTGKEAHTLLTCKDIPLDRHTRYYTAFTTGMRDSEISGLMWGDLDTAEKTIKVERQLKRNKKGHYSPDLFKLPKKGSLRVLPVHPKTLEKLSTWKKAYQAYCGHEPQDNRPIFPSIDGMFYHPHSAALIRRDLKKAELSDMFQGVNGTTFPFDFHATRRTFASMLDALNVERGRISALLGHKANGVTARNYLAKNMIHCRKDINKLTI